MRSSRLSCWALALTASAAAWAGCAPATWAATPAYPAFPVSADLPTVAAWLRAQTNVDLGAVVGVGDDSVFILEPTSDPAPPPTIRATIRQEVINADFAAALGGRSAIMIADIDCDGRRVFQRALDLYAGNNRQGAVRRLGAAADWQAAPPNSFMDNVVAAVCEPDYAPIFPGGQVASAEPPGQVALLGRPGERSPATSLAPVLPSRGAIPMIAPVAPARPAPAPAASPAPVLAQASPAPLSVAAPPPPPPTPRPAPVAAVAQAPSNPDGPIATQPMARPLLIAPPPSAAPPPVRSAPVAAPPSTAVAAAPLAPVTAPPAPAAPAPRAEPAPIAVAAVQPPPPAAPPAAQVRAAAPVPAQAPAPPPATRAAAPSVAARASGPGPAPARPATPPRPAPPRTAPAAEPPSAGALGLRPLALGRAQIGSFASADAAIAAWRALAAARPDLMAGKRQRIELSTATGVTRFRAFVDGFAGRGEAEAFCRTLRAQGEACIASD